MSSPVEDPRIDALERLVVRMFTALSIDEPGLADGLDIRDETGLEAITGRFGEANRHISRLLGLVELEKGKLRQT